MTDKTPDDGGPADFLTDEAAEAICQTIATGYGKGGFPINRKTQELMGWYDWLRDKIGDAMLAERMKGADDER